MKICPVCGAQMPDDRAFCSSCGAKVDSAEAPAQPNPAAPYAQPIADPYDHTAEFDPKDASDNKVFALAIYMTGVIGLVIALFACKDSEYIRFHIRQYMKMLVADAFLGLATVLLCWTFIVPAAASVCTIIIAVLQIIAFFQVAGGKSKEPAILRDLKWFK